MEEEEAWRLNFGACLLLCRHSSELRRSVESPRSAGARRALKSTDAAGATRAAGSSLQALDGLLLAALASLDLRGSRRARQRSHDSAARATLSVRG